MSLPVSTVNTSDVRECVAIFKRVDMITLRQLITTANAELNHKRETQRGEALRQIAILAEEFNMTGKEIAALVGKRVKPSKLPSKLIRFQHPDDHKLTWTGNGKRPSWVNSWMEQHGTLDALRVSELKQAA